MQDDMSALRTENESLRQRVSELEGSETVRVRERAAEKVGLSPTVARWLTGDTPEEAEADARAFAAVAGTAAPPSSDPSTRTVGEAIAESMQAQNDLAATLSGNCQPEGQA